jgi:hypothetical protein
LGDETFRSKAPQKVIDGITQKLEGYKTQLAKINKALGS